MIVKATPEETKEEETLEASLRPRRWDEYMGEEKIKNNLRGIIEGTKKNQKTLKQILI